MITDALRRHLTGIALATAVLGVGGVAAAQSASNQAAAQALFEEGRKLMNDGRYADACPKLADSQRLDPGPGTLINLAACYEKNGQSASAWATYKEAIGAAEKSNRPEWSTRARQRAAGLEPTLRRLTIVVGQAARTNGLSVRRDGVEVSSGEWGVAIPVDPGTISVTAAAPGHATWTSRVDVKATGPATVTVNVPALESAPSTTSPAVDPRPVTPAVGAEPSPSDDGASRTRGNGQRTTGLVLGAAGIVGIGLGTYFGLSAISRRDDARPNCNDDLSSCNQAGIDAIDGAKSKALISTVSLIAGGALVAGGVIVYVTAPKRGTQRRDSLAVGPAAAGWGLGLHGTFE